MFLQKYSALLRFPSTWTLAQPRCFLSKRWFTLPNEQPLVTELRGSARTHYYPSTRSNRLKVVQETTEDSRSAHFWLLRVFFPRGYPNTVSSDYVDYTKWYFAQSVLSSSGYLLCTHSMLTAVGVSSGTSIPLSAAASWVLKDGLGSLGSMFVAKVYGSSFDHHTKRSRWTADCLFNLGAAVP